MRRNLPTSCLLLVMMCWILHAAGCPAANDDDSDDDDAGDDDAGDDDAGDDDAGDDDAGDDAGDDDAGDDDTAFVTCDEEPLVCTDIGPDAASQWTGCCHENAVYWCNADMLMLHLCKWEGPNSECWLNPKSGQMECTLKP